MQHARNVHNRSSSAGALRPDPSNEKGPAVTRLARFFLGGLLVYASIDKILNPAAFAEVVFNYRILPDDLINLTAILLPPFELVLGVLLLLGHWLAGGVLLSSSVLSVFFLSVAFNLARGLNVDCGCFTSSSASASQAEMIWYVVRDALFLVPAFYLLYRLRQTDGTLPGRTNAAGSFRRRALLQAAFILILSAAFAWCVNALRPEPLPLTENWSPASRLELENGEILTISLEEAEEAFANGAAFFADARSTEAYLAGHILGAVNLPWDQFDILFEPVMGPIPLDALIITYCDGETCGLGIELARALRGQGYENVRVLINGWSLWVAQHLPTEP